MSLVGVNAPEAAAWNQAAVNHAQGSRYSVHPPRDEYLLTDTGRAIEPILRELQTWGETYAL
jgi:hypothetical protein